MKPINLAQKLSTFHDYWQPRTVGQFNGHDLMVVKVKGEFSWHSHADTDDFFLVQETHLLLIEPTGTPNTGNAATAASRQVI